MERILNLGSGNDYRNGQVNIDYYAEKVDVRHDLNKFPYPFNDGEFDKIICLNIIEHLDDVIAVMKELHRIGKDNCIIKIRVPHFRSCSLHEDLTHKRGFAWKSMGIFLEKDGIYGDYSDSKFEVINTHYEPFEIKYGQRTIIEIKLLYRILSKMPTLTDHLLSKYIPMGSMSFVMRVIK